MFVKDPETSEIILDSHSIPQFLTTVKTCLKRKDLFLKGKEFLEQLHPTSIERILSSPRRGYQYLYILKRLSKEGKIERNLVYEDTLVGNKSTKYFYLYSRNLIKERVKGLEQVVFSKEEEGPSTIREVTYIKHVIKERTPEAEPYIMRSPKHVLDYYIDFLTDLEN